MGPLFSAAILAGGQARRLGGTDKSALVVGTRSILDRQLSLLRGLTPHIIIVASDESHVRVAGVRVVRDRITGAGSLGGLYTALMEAPTEQVLVIACDMPFLTTPFLAHLAQRGYHADAAIPRDARGRHPLCASYTRRVAAHLHDRIALGDLRVGEAVAALQVLEIGPDELQIFDPDGRLLANVNTPADYEQIRQIHANRTAE